MLATLVHLRHGGTRDVLAPLVRRGPLHHHRAIGEVRPLLAQRGCSVAPDVRLHSLAEVIERLGATGQTAIVDATEVRVRRPAAGTPGRNSYVSGKSKQDAMKALILTDAARRLLFGGAIRPGSCPDITQARDAGLVNLFSGRVGLEILAVAGYQGLGAQTGGQVITPSHRKFKRNAPPWWRRCSSNSARCIRLDAFGTSTVSPI
ncbi:transposase family protein [Streptomyces violens]|uniref:transposase family protein n=1 Tax=Streptomyces violens TaxID=66377 RepID=UPI000ADFF9D6|nr:transposase family protein [Streptomyces violens]